MALLNDSRKSDLEVFTEWHSFLREMREYFKRHSAPSTARKSHIETTRLSRYEPEVLESESAKSSLYLSEIKEL